MEPKTRKEFYLAKMAGEDVTVPEPVTRQEMYMAEIIENGGGGGGAGVDRIPYVYFNGELYCVVTEKDGTTPWFPTEPVAGVLVEYENDVLCFYIYNGYAKIDPANNKPVFEQINRGDVMYDLQAEQEDGEWKYVLIITTT